MSRGCAGFWHHIFSASNVLGVQVCLSQACMHDVARASAVPLDATWHMPCIAPAACAFWLLTMRQQSILSRVLYSPLKEHCWMTSVDPVVAARNSGSNSR